MDEEFLAVPDVIKIAAGLGMLDTCGVTSCDEVSDTAVDTGGGVPHDLCGATVVHGRGPDGKNGVFGFQSVI